MIVVRARRGRSTEAAKAAQDWMDAGVFYHVSRADKFADGDGLYRFREDEVRGHPYPEGDGWGLAEVLC